MSFDIVAKNGNSVEPTFDFVEATFDLVKRIVRLVAFDNVASTLLVMWTGLNNRVNEPDSKTTRMFRPIR